MTGHGGMGMTDLRHVPASMLSLAGLTAALDRAFEGYFVPLKHTAESLGAMIATTDISVDSSIVALDPDGAAAGVALLGIRGTRGWIGGMGLAPAWRGRGHAMPLMRAVLARATACGVTGIQLEVLDQNAPARHLYARLGFDQPRPLDIFMGPLAQPGSCIGAHAERAYPVADAHLSALLNRFSDYHPVEPPWQRQQVSLERMVGLEAMAVGGDARTCLLYSRNPHGVSLLDLGSRAPTTNQRHDDALILFSALLGDTPAASVRAINVPPGDPLGDVLRTCGCPVVQRQRELRLKLA